MPAEAIFSSDTIAEYAQRPHAVNVLIDEYTWQRLKETARQDGMSSVSEVARCALSGYLGRLPYSEHVTDIAQAAIELEVKVAEMRASTRAAISMTTTESL